MRRARGHLPLWGPVAPRVFSPGLECSGRALRRVSLRQRAPLTEAPTVNLRPRAPDTEGSVA
eukprot:11978303-Alexandrium_andersonii.AAC.1